MNYNTDLPLWENTRASQERAGRFYPLTVTQGCVINGSHIVARFSSQRNAVETLTRAGWVDDISHNPQPGFRYFRSCDSLAKIA